MAPDIIERALENVST